MNNVTPFGKCPTHGVNLDIESERGEQHLKLILYCPKCGECKASCYLPWSEFQEDKPDD